MKDKIQSSVELEDEEMFAIRVNISDITDLGYELQSEIDPKALERRVNSSAHSKLQPDITFSNEFSFPESPKVKVRFDKEGSIIYMTGEIRARFSTLCSRCADELEQEVTIPVKYIYKKYSQRLRPEDQLPDLDLGFYDGLQLDVGDVVRDVLILSLPFTPLCSPDCEGVCPNCGANRNRENCQCDTPKSGLGLLSGIKLQ